MWIAPSLRIGMAVFAIVTAWQAPWGANLVKETAAIDQARSDIFRTQADSALTQWAISRFEQAGLELPSLTIGFHDDKQPCNGYFGFYRASTPARIDICGFNWDRFLVTPKTTVLHELAHAWADANLTEETRQGFLTLRGLATWGDDAVPWEDQGSEQAAEIIAWALMDREPPMAKIEDAHPETLARAYLHLTGKLPLLRVQELLAVIWSQRGEGV